MNERDIFIAAIRIDDTATREGYLDEACGEDVALRQRVIALLKANKRAGEFLEPPERNIDATVEHSGIDRQLGGEIGAYKLREELGRGGFGVVYVAEQAKPLRRKVAIKIIKPGMDTKEVIARFEAERQALALMDHPNIARVLDAGATEQGHPYFVMELVHGVPITEFCDKNKLPIRQRLELFLDVCHAVQHAHQKGIIHRDLKPNNIMITLHDGKPVPKVIDFGVAKALSQQLTERTIYTSYGQVIGTPQYMSPEQAEMSGLGIDTRSDIYSLGVLLYELLTGQTPVDANRLFASGYGEMMRIIREEDPPRPSTKVSTLGEEATVIAQNHCTDVKTLRRSLRGELDWIVMKALDKDRERRYETANSFAGDIRRYLNDEAVQACPPSTSYRVRKFVRRYRGPVIAAAGLLLVLCLGLVGTSIGLAWARIAERKATEARDQAETFAWENAQLAIRERDAKQEAQQKSRELEEQLRVSLVTQLAARSQAIREELPLQSVLLAMEAVNASRRDDGTVMPVAHETLLSNVATIGGLPLPGHEGRSRIYALPITSDSRWLVTAAGWHRGEARLWDLTAEDPASQPRILAGHTGRVWDTVISPDDRWLITASTDKTLRIWDLQAEDPGLFALELRGHAGPVGKVAISPNGRWLATGSRDSTARLWDLKDLNPADLISSPVNSDQLGEHRGWVEALAISPDGHWLATGSHDSVARLWNLTADDPAAAALVLPGHRDAVISVAFSPNGRWLVTGSRDTTARLWDLTAPDPASSSIVLEGHRHAVPAVAFDSIGRRLVTGSRDWTARLWDLTSADPAASSRVMHGHEGSVYAVAISPNDRWLVTGSWDNTARIWDLTVHDPAAASIELRGHEGWVNHVSISPNGRWLATGGFDGIPRLWDLASVNPASSLVLRRHEGSVSKVVISPDHRWLVTASDDGTARLWELTGSSGDPVGSSRVLRGHERNVSSVAISSNGRWLVTGSWDGTARRWDLNSEDPTKSSRVFRGSSGKIVSVAISPKGRWLVTGDEAETAELWDLAELDWAPRQLPGYQADEWSPATTAISPNGRWLVIAAATANSKVGRENVVHLWNLNAADPPASPTTLTRSDDWSGTSCVAFSPNSRWLVAGRPRGAYLWDLAASNPASSLCVLEGHTSAVMSLAISQDSRWLVTASFDNTARIWDLTAKDPAARSFVLADHSFPLVSVAISPDGHWVVTGAEDKTARVWDLTAEDPAVSSLVLRGHKDKVTSVAFSPDSRWVITGSGDRTVRLWDLHLDSLIERARRLAGRELTPEERKQYMVGKP